MLDSLKILSELNKEYPLHFTSIELLREGGCKTYIIHDEKQKYFLKIVSSAFRKTIIQSAEIIEYLYQNNIPVPHIIKTKKNDLYFSLDNTNEENIFILFNFIEGVGVDSGEDVEKISELIGKLHSAMKNYKGTLLKHDKQFFIDRYIGILKLKDYHFSKLQLYIDYGDYLWDKVKLLPTGYCHGDMHYGNLLKTNYNEYILLDFDTSCYAYPMFDITLMCDATNYFELTPEEYDNSQKTYERFLNGYQKYRTINNDEYNSFYNWIAIRHFQLQATLVEVFGVNCINENYIDDQLDWLTQWINLCEKNR